MLLLRNAEIFAPTPRGHGHLLVSQGRIAWMGADDIDLPAALGASVVDLEGRRVIPGLIDCHTHLSGGGGETGYASRVPALHLTQLTRAGVTTAIGLLGTDDTIRTPGEVLAHARGLRAQGLSTWCWTGGYHVPPCTITGSVRGDLVHIDLVIGVGELALSDHRSSQPTLDELVRIAGDCHVGGLMTGKAGVLHLHLGDGPRGLELVRAALTEAEIPARVYHPTHVNRKRALLEEAFALADKGCTIDVTAFPPEDDDDVVPAARAIRAYLERGLPIARLTCSSDGGGCLPQFDAAGRAVGAEVATPSTLGDTLRALLAAGVPLATAVKPFTDNVADHLRLPRKGTLCPGADADLIVLDDESRFADVLAGGVWMVRDGVAVQRGPFED